MIQNIASILGTSLASLLGAGAEYHANAASYQARMQQLEKNASHIVALFSPLSYLLTTEEYDEYLALMIEEAEAPGSRALVPEATAGPRCWRRSGSVESRPASTRRRSPVSIRSRSCGDC